MRSFCCGRVRSSGRETRGSSSGTSSWWTGAGVKPLPVSIVGWNLYKAGKIAQSEIPLTVEEAAERFAPLLGGRPLELPALPPAPERGEALIRLEQVRFGYGDGRQVLDGVDLTIHKGDYLALIGQNGAGKTTLAKLFNSIHKPTGGRVTVLRPGHRRGGAEHPRAGDRLCLSEPRQPDFFHQRL